MSMRTSSRLPKRPYPTIVSGTGSGHAYEAFQIGYRRLCEVPAQLDEDDFYYLGQLDPALAKTARFAQKFAVAARKRVFEAQLARQQQAPRRPSGGTVAWPTQKDIDADDGFEAFLKQHPRDALPIGLFHGLFKGLKNFVLEINERNKDRNAKIEALEKRCAELETHLHLTKSAQPGTIGASDVSNTIDQRLKRLENQALNYRGVYKPELPYGVGSLVTKNGAMWLAERATCNTPGQPDSGWRLVVKSVGGKG